jgi:lipid II:glycine glycyltransferase (peptidoglycan interpeptide bridge formation enzyme)
VVDLSAGLENALARIDGKYRRMAGQAERRGVDCVQFTGVDAVDTYYGLLRESAKRWGIPEPAERRALISALQQYGGSSVEIWFALFEDRPIAGGVVFYGSREFFFWSAAMLAEFGRLRPSNALNYALLHAAAAKGMRWYNLGASEGLPGVERFKSGLGAQDVPYEALELSRIPFKLYTNVKRVLAARVHR